MIFRMAYRMAMADGELSANETLILHLLGEGLKATRQELERLRKEAGDLDWASLPLEFPERRDQMELFEVACLMAMIDGRSDLQEWGVIMRLCEVLAIERPEAQAALARARERMMALAERHNLLPEIVENIRRAEEEEALDGEEEKP
jgi:hypothetical protein